MTKNQVIAKARDLQNELDYILQPVIVKMDEPLHEFRIEKEWVPSGCRVEVTVHIFKSGTPISFPPQHPLAASVAYYLLHLAEEWRQGDIDDLWEAVEDYVDGKPMLTLNAARSRDSYEMPF